MTDLKDVLKPLWLTKKKTVSTTECSRAYLKHFFP